MSNMQRIKEIEAEIEEVKKVFEQRKKELDNVPLVYYSERDDKIAALLEERDKLHSQVVGGSK